MLHGRTLPNPLAPPLAGVGMRGQLPTMSELLIVRHGRTEMNEYLARPGKGWGSQDFEDPGLWDTRLTPAGEDQARALRDVKLRDVQQVDLLLASPLRRALQTADLAFSNVVCGVRTVTPLAAERCFLSSDVGSPPAELTSEFGPRWQLDALPETWWYTCEEVQEEWRPPGTYLNAGEPDEAFYARMRALLALLRNALSTNATVALVAHWGVNYALTGRSMQNCEFVRLHTSELPADPFVIPD